MKNFYKPVLLLPGICISLFVNAQPVPSLNSFINARTVIYLDFDGQTVAGTSWNVNGTFSCKSSGLNNSQITEVFNRVSEDFRPFNINVTTSEIIFNQAPVNRRIRIIITSSHQWYGSAAGGVAFLNSFVWGDNTPAFVFSSLFNYSVKYIAESVSHETGHTFGLRHQSIYTGSCEKIAEYNWGHGTGEIGWAPIMGAGYNQNMTLWHNGPNSTGCKNMQSDLGIISNEINGFGYRTDDHAATFLNATQINFINNQFNMSGVVERTDDKDLFKFIMPENGRFRLNAIPNNIGTGNAGSDLDLQIELLDSASRLLGTYNPGLLLSSVIDTFLMAGIFYIRVEGKGNIYAPEYASLGSYSLQGFYSQESVTAKNSIELHGRADKDIHQLQWLIKTKETVKSQIIEIANEGRNFYPLYIPATNERTYQYFSKENKPLHYRIHVTLADNKDYYSNNISIRQGTVSVPQLIGNITNGTTISVSSPGNFQYLVTDPGGKTIMKGSVQNGFNSIRTGNLTPGLYIIRFSNAENSRTEKFLKN
ncbi:MAG TPA: zinc-dependent metalloprotease [Chitinophagaceae bacterium]|nr:zinc-dependent metalloprotease [Chitinophagaceae bacterium]